MTDMDWRDSANCLGVEPGAMTPDAATPGEVEAALSLCADCIVRLQCDQLRAEQHYPYGVWAGKWWGDPPTDPTVTPCGWCGEATGSARATYCSPACGKRALRAREAIPA